MKKNLIIVLLSLIVVLTGFTNLKTEYKITEITSSEENEIYSQILQVKQVDYDSGKITFQDYLNNEYIFLLEGVEDIYQEEFYTCTMFKNGTEKIYDDTILNIKYQRLDLWESLKETYKKPLLCKYNEFYEETKNGQYICYNIIVLEDEQGNIYKFNSKGFMGVENTYYECIMHKNNTNDQKDDIILNMIVNETIFGNTGNM